MISGAIVHSTSIDCPYKRNRFAKLLIITIIIVYDTTVRIITININGDNVIRLKTGSWGEYLGPRGMRMGSGEGSTMRNLIVCTVHLI